MEGGRGRMGKEGMRGGFDRAILYACTKSPIEEKKNERATS